MGRVEFGQILETMLDHAKSENARFSRQSYDAQFASINSQYSEVLRAIEAMYHEEGDNEEVFEFFASVLCDHASEEILKLKKGKQSVAIIDYNMAMVSFVFPMIDKQRTNAMDLFADKCVVAWNLKFPKGKIEKSNLEMIQSGFKSKLCYITTAVCESMDKGDDCYDLTLLRGYRDGYLLHDVEDGSSIVETYYDIAPTIVNRINREKNSQEIYDGIWKQYLQPCIQLIEEEKMEETKELYTTMVHNLSEIYLH